MPNHVRITDVSPRDGLQNEPGVIPTADKARLIQLLCKTGLDEIEVASFVSPKWVPQLADGAELLALLGPGGVPGAKPPLPAFSVLIPNEKGLAAALACIDAGARINKASVFTAASEAFNQRNTNATIAQSIDRFRPVIEQAHARGLPVRAYISCAIACPLQGPIAPAQVARVARMLVELGVDELDLADTIGAATPETTRLMLNTVLAEIGHEWLDPESLTLHLHDTLGHADDSVRAALDLGLCSFDGSAAGLGGCPYASTPGKRAPGNISTDLLVRTITSAGYTTRVNLDALAIASQFATRIVNQSRAATPGNTP